MLDTFRCHGWHLGFVSLCSVHEESTVGHVCSCQGSVYDHVEDCMLCSCEKNAAQVM